MRKIFAWIAPIVWFGDEIVRRIVYWAAFIALLSAPMSWAASNIAAIAQYGWGAVVFAGVFAACVITLVICGAVVTWRYLHPLPKQSSTSEGEAPAPRYPPRIVHVRSSVSFDKLEDGRLIILVLEFLNASAEEITLQSANGHLSYVGFNGVSEKTLHPVTWPDERQHPRAKPFDDMPIVFHQCPPPESIQPMLEYVHNGKPFSIKFHLQIKAKVLATGEIVEIRSWDGVSCQTKNMPVVTGQTVPLAGMSSR